MDEAIRRALVRFGYSSIAAGFKLPRTVSGLISDFFDRSALKDLLKQLRINYVLDVGANNGSFARNLRRMGYGGHIVCFEPNREDFLNMRNAFKADMFWKGFNFALGSEDTIKTFNICKLSNLSSFLNPIGKIEVVGTTEIEVKRLDSIFHSLTNTIENPRIFLKIDTQGYDLEVIEGARGCIQNIVGLQSEISVQPIYENMPHYLESLKFYESLGFQLMDLFPVSRGKYGNIIEYDCLMAR